MTVNYGAAVVGIPAAVTSAQTEPPPVDKVVARGNLGSLNKQADSAVMGLDAAMRVNAGRADGSFAGMAAPAAMVLQLQENQALYDKLAALDEAQLSGNMKEFIALFEAAQVVVAYIMKNAQTIRDEQGVDVDSIHFDADGFASIFALIREAHSGLLGAAEVQASMEAESMERRLEKNVETVEAERDAADKEFTKTTAEGASAVGSSAVGTVLAGTSAVKAGSSVAASKSAAGVRQDAGARRDAAEASQLRDRAKGHELDAQAHSQDAGRYEQASRLATEGGRASSTMATAEAERDVAMDRARAKEKDLALQIFGSQGQADKETGGALVRTAGELLSQLSSALKESADAFKAAAQTH